MDEIQTPISGSGLSPSVPIKSRGLVVKIIVGVVVVAVVGTGISLATRIWDPLWNPFRPAPEEVLEEMLTKMEEVKTLHSEMKINIEATDEIDEELEKEETQISMVFGGDSDVTDPENLKSALGFDFEIMGGGLEEGLSLAGEIRTIGKNSYFKLTTINIPAETESLLMMFGVDLDKIEKQWIETDKEALESLGGGISRDELSEEEQEEMMEKIKVFFAEKKIYYVKEELPDGKIGRSKMYHYLLALDKEEIKKILPELFETIMESSEEPGMGFGITFIAGALAGATERLLDKVGEITADFWIGKKDLLLYKVEGEKEIELSKFDKTAQGTITIKMDIEFSNFNQPVTIEAPENFINLEEIISPMLFLQPGLPGGTPGM